MSEPTAVAENQLPVPEEPPLGCGRARLSWANGALSFLNGPHAWMLGELVRYYPDSKGVDKPFLPVVDPETGEQMELPLMSKYVLSSPENSGVLVMALAHNPKGKGKGREAYLMSRAGTIVSTKKIMLPDVSVIERGRTRRPLTAEGTEQQLVVISVEGRDDIVKWKLGLLSAREHMSEDQQVLHQCTGHDPDDERSVALPEWANQAIVLVEQGGMEAAKHIIQSNKTALRKGDIVISSAFSDLIWNLLKTKIHDFVFMYTIKGNLRYRIEKLGIEQGHDVTAEQRTLCRIADEQTDALQRWERMMGKPAVPPGWGVAMTEDDLVALPTDEKAAESVVRSWTHPYACPKCGLAFMKWGLCYTHMNNCEACDELMSDYSLDELLEICRTAEPKAEGSVNGLFSTSSDVAHAEGNVRGTVYQ